MERIIFVHEKSRIGRFVFGGEFRAKFCENFSRPGSENFDFRCWATPIITTSMPMFATYRAKVEHSISLVRIASPSFVRQQFFFGVSVTIKGDKTCQSGRIFVWDFPTLCQEQRYFFSYLLIWIREPSAVTWSLLGRERALGVRKLFR